MLASHDATVEVLYPLVGLPVGVEGRGLRQHPRVSVFSQFAFHERVERWSEIDWQLLYLPILGLAAAAWWGVVRRHRESAAAVRGLIAAAAAWFIALLLELVQNWGGEPVAASVYNPAMILEEGLEMVGSTALIIAGLVVLARRSAPTRDA